LILGLGNKEELTADSFRTASTSVVKHIAGAKLERVNVRITGLAQEAAMGRSFGEALGLLGWSGRDFLGTASDPDESVDLHVGVHEEEFMRGARTGLGLAEAANYARELVFTPPAQATPMYMAAQAQALADRFGLECRVVQGDELVAEKMAGISHVGMASDNPPCLIRLEYTPEGGSDLKPVVLIGKTITYDTGGLSIKGKTGMPGMKADKGGGCAVLGAMQAVADVIKPDFPVVALLPAAENSISGNAYRPDDVIRFRNGVTVEVTNTDAEGRLVLADALCWATDKEEPACIVDMATLTGGVVTALGSEYAGCFSSSDMMVADLEEAGRVSGEKVWRLPVDKAYRAMLKSPIADIVNSALGGKAHPVQGAVFLSHFVGEDIPWAHIDIAGVAVTKEALPMFKPGPTGFGVRLIADLLRGRPSVLPVDWQ
jgi:leucyl aminopeptidase